MKNSRSIAICIALGALASFSTPSSAADCDIERPSEEAGCKRAELDRTLHLNDLQAVGTHNSYKQALPPAEMAALAMAAPGVAKTLDYSHPPLTDQLDAGARQLELDLLHDPEGGRYADPLIRRMLKAKAGAYDPAPMRFPGLKVLHVPDFDFRTSCTFFTQCLRTIRAWSKAHPDHLPILILINLKEDKAQAPGGVDALQFDAKAMDAIDADIASVFGPGDVITPD